MIECPIDNATLDAMTRGYLECAAWADAPEGSAARFTREARDIARTMCRIFATMAGPLILQALQCDGYEAERLGHDLWLTRCGHGTGYWDRDELECPPIERVPFVDRDGKPQQWAADATLGEALKAICYGAEWISPLAYPSLDAYRGWLYFNDAASLSLAREGRSPWVDRFGQYLD